MRHITERADAPNANGGLSSEPALGGAARVAVAGYPDRPTFSVLARTPRIQKYPCTTCHTRPLAEMRAGGPHKRAHWDITLQHASAAVMACTTCHASADLDLLRTLQDAKVTFDYQAQNEQGGKDGGVVTAYYDIRQNEAG